MGEYRITRNIEASIIQYIADEFSGDWNNVNVEQTFAKIYDISLPGVCVRCGTTDHTTAELGGNSTVRTPQVLIDVFATSDGNRLDIKDFLIEKLKNGMPYYEYTVANGAIQSKTQNGRIRVTEIADIPINFESDKDTLDVHDRYRHLLTLTVSLGRVEV